MKNSITILFTISLLLVSNVLISQPVPNLGGEEVTVSDAPKPAITLGVGSPEWLAAIKSLDSLHIALVTTTFQHGFPFELMGDGMTKTRPYDVLNVFVYLDDIHAFQMHLLNKTYENSNTSSRRTFDRRPNAAPLRTTTQPTSRPTRPSGIGLTTNDPAAERRAVASYPFVQEHFRRSNELVANPQFKAFPTGNNFSDIEIVDQFIQLKNLYMLVSSEGFGMQGDDPYTTRSYFFKPCQGMAKGLTKTFSGEIGELINQEIDRQWVLRGSARHKQAQASGLYSPLQFKQLKSETVVPFLDQTPLNLEAQIYLANMANRTNEIAQPLRIQLNQLKASLVRYHSYLSREEQIFFQWAIQEAANILQPLELLASQARAIANKPASQTTYGQLASMGQLVLYCNKRVPAFAPSYDQDILEGFIKNYYNKVRELETRYNDLKAQD